MGSAGLLLFLFAEGSSVLVEPGGFVNFSRLFECSLFRLHFFYEHQIYPAIADIILQYAV